MTHRINLDFDYPQVDLPSPILGWYDITDDLLNLYKQPCRLQAGIFALCLRGEMDVVINLIDYTVKEGDLITLFPGSIIQFVNAQTPIRICFLGYSSDTMSQINLMEIASSSYHKIIEKPIINIPEPYRNYIKDYFTLWGKLSNDDSISIRPEIVYHSMISMIYSANSIYNKQPYIATPKTRQEEIYRDLLMLITQNYMNERTAQFYADKLKLTPQHLSTTVRQVTGGTVLDLIAHVVIMDAKAKLKSSNMTVQEISYALNFPTPSFFGKYFKRYVGMSPLTYRQKS